MIASMTAFSRQQSHHTWGSLILEIRSVNHRYLDLTFKLPEPLRGLEMLWREEIKKQLGRGKVECQLRFQVQAQQQSELAIDQILLDQVISAATRLQQSLGSDTAINPLELLRWPGVLGESEVTNDEIPHEATRLLKNSLSMLLEARHREGAKLVDVIDERISRIENIVVDTRSKLPTILGQQRTRLLARLTELKVEVDQQRLEQELVYLAQKADVDEELDRLDTHLTEVKRTLSKGGACGRRLDFLMQELHREANTLSSKSVSSQTTQNSVELKVLIEQMREQVQNIE